MTVSFCLQVNNHNMTEASHMQAVTALRNAHRKCILKVSREVLIVLPDDTSFDEDSLGLNDNDKEQTTPVLDNGTAMGSPPVSPNIPKPVMTEATTGQRIEPMENGDVRPEEQESDPNLSPQSRTRGYSEGEALLLDSDRVVVSKERRGSEQIEVPAEEEEPKLSVIMDEIIRNSLLKEGTPVRDDEGENRTEEGNIPASNEVSKDEEDSGTVQIHVNHVLE